MTGALADEQSEPAVPASTLVGESSVYMLRDGFVDEVFASRGAPREHAAELVSSLDRMGRLVLMDLGRRRDETFRQQGITFAISDPSGAAQDRPFPLDLVPRIIPAHEWDAIERGLIQRIKGAQRVPRRRLRRPRDRPRGDRPLGAGPRLAGVPARGARHPAPGRHRLPRRGIDLVRDGDGRWKVLEDNLRTPVGHLLRAREPAGDDAAAAASCSAATACAPSTTTRSCC